MHQTAFKIIKGNPFHCKLLMLELLECNISFFFLVTYIANGKLGLGEKKKNRDKTRIHIQFCN